LENGGLYARLYATQFRRDEGNAEKRMG
jgi:hypothetical protein